MNLYFRLYINIQCFYSHCARHIKYTLNFGCILSHLLSHKIISTKIPKQHESLVGNQVSWLPIIQLSFSSFLKLLMIILALNQFAYRQFLSP